MIVKNPLPRGKIAHVVNRFLARLIFFQQKSDFFLDSGIKMPKALSLLLEFECKFEFHPFLRSVGRF